MPKGKKMYSPELKYEIVQRYLDGDGSLRSLATEYHVDKADIQKWRDSSNKNDGNTSSKTGEKKETAKVVATGDYANIALYAGLAMAALLVLIVLVVYKKKCTK